MSVLDDLIGGGGTPDGDGRFNHYTIDQLMAYLQQRMGEITQFWLLGSPPTWPGDDPDQVGSQGLPSITDGNFLDALQQALDRYNDMRNLLDLMMALGYLDLGAPPANPDDRVNSSLYSSFMPGGSYYVDPSLLNDLSQQMKDFLHMAGHPSYTNEPPTYDGPLP